MLVAAYNEGAQIAQVLKAVSEYVDHIVVVDDASTDDTVQVVKQCASEDARVLLIPLSENSGVGGALAHAYNWAKDHDVDIAVSIDGDGQMNLEEMGRLLDPIVRGQADYTKGNRLADPEGWRQIPRLRLFGNAVLSLLTKMASGYWAVVDSQSGYSAAGRVALERIDWGSMYRRYGRPNDVLVLANVAELRVADVPVTPVYGVGERSSMRIAKVTLAISWLLIRRFWWRLFQKYLFRDFHPLLFFYLLATATMLIAGGLFLRLAYFWIANGNVPQMTALALAFFTITSLNSLFFAYWMDMQANAHLAVKLPFQWPTQPGVTENANR
ncbi:MAG: glycosyltransferase family 2 protein [Acidimicrobiia bacterium]|nr:glycosyltransferase family 2 protein [Acidimicrobiia bacterium]